VKDKVKKERRDLKEEWIGNKDMNGSEILGKC
jgi:hypothetical protein